MQLGSLFRGVRSFKGKLRLANLLINRDGTDVRIDSRAGKFLLPNITDNQYFELYVNGIYEKKLVDYIIANLPHGGTLLDIGANIGSISIPVALARADARIIAIEALPVNYRYLTENLALNKVPNVQALNLCCSDSDGKTVRFYHHDKLKGNSSFHSLHTSHFVELTTCTVDLKLKEIGVEKVDLLKIDTEGSEALIFRGALETLKSSRPLVLFEFIAAYEAATEGLRPGESQEILRSLGYTLYYFDQYPQLKAVDGLLTKDGYELLALCN